MPESEYGALTWDGERFWLHDRDTGAAVAVTRAPGQVTRRLGVPEKTAGIAWAETRLAAARTEPKSVVFLDSESGATGREIALEF